MGKKSELLLDTTCIECDMCSNYENMYVCIHIAVLASPSLQTELSDEIANNIRRPDENRLAQGSTFSCDGVI